MSRISKKDLIELTGKSRLSTQKKWFKVNFCIDVPTDNQGPIITDQAFEALIKSKLKLSNTPEDTHRPKLRLINE